MKDLIVGVAAHSDPHFEEITKKEHHGGKNMKKTINKIIIALFILALFIIPTKVYAAGSFSLSRGSASLNPGGTTTITITASNCAGQFSISSSNTNVATVNTSSTWLDNSSITVTVTAKGEGTANINITATDVTDTDLNDIGGTKTCTITVTKPAPVQQETQKPATQETTKPSTGNNTSTNTNTNTKTTTTTTQKPKVETPEVVKSSVSTLKEIVVEGQTLSPEFDVDVKEYTVNVPYETTTIKVEATPMDEKATVKVEEIEELKEGENIITITVTAEDESTATYTIKVNRGREPLTVKTLVVKYINQEGKTVEIPLTPKFDEKTKEYKLEDIEHWVDKLLIEVKPNLEKATIKIEGADKLTVGENTITITVSIKEEQENLEEGQEVQEPKEEKLVYKIKVNKNTEPTFMEKAKDKFMGIFGGIYTWYNNNQGKIIMYALCACVLALIILSVYIVIDYKKYKVLIVKLKTLEELNTQEIVQENVTQTTTIETESEDIQNEEVSEPSKKAKGGKHF